MYEYCFYLMNRSIQYLCLLIPERHARQMFYGLVGNISLKTLRSLMLSSYPVLVNIDSVVKRLHIFSASSLPLGSFTRPTAQSQPFQQIAIDGLQLIIKDKNTKCKFPCKRHSITLLRNECCRYRLMTFDLKLIIYLLLSGLKIYKN